MYFDLQVGRVPEEKNTTKFQTASSVFITTYTLRAEKSASGPSAGAKNAAILEVMLLTNYFS